MIYRADVVAAARDLIGTPFRHRGRLPGVGIDCLNVVGYVGLALGVDGSERWERDVDLLVYDRTPQRPDLLLRKCEEYLDRVELANICPGDIVLMAFSYFPQHFAIVTACAPLYGVHAYPLPPLDRVVESRLPAAKSRIVRAYKFRGVV